jgi:hypothetical protein
LVLTVTLAGGFRKFDLVDHHHEEDLAEDSGADMSAIFTGSLVGLLHIAAVWSIAVTLAIAATGPISGAHLNPVFSVAFAWGPLASPKF